MQSVLKHEKQKKLYSTAKNAEKFQQEFQIEVDLQKIEGENDPIKKLKLEAKKAALKNHLDNWKNKPLHGQFPTRVDKADIDKELTYKWLKSSELKGETEASSWQHKTKVGQRKPNNAAYMASPMIRSADYVACSTRL